MTTTVSADIRAGRDPRRWWALFAITLSVLAAGLDITVLSVALPTLALALRASESDLQWFSSAYALVLSAGMLPAGVLGDRYGRRKVMAGSLVLFGIGSLACAYAPSPAIFIAARTLLGIAAAGLTVMALSSLTVLFDETERPRAVGIWAAANFLSLPVGPLLGGWLLAHYWWGWVFLLNLPVALIGIAAVLLLVPETRAPSPPALDLIGIVTSCAGLVGVTYGLIELGRNGWTDVGSWLACLLGVVVLAAFVLWERRLAASGGEPLVDLALFRSPAFTWGVILAAAGVLSMIGVLFTMPQFFQGVAGTDAQGSGLRLLPLIAGIVCGAVPADRIAARAGSKLTVAFGFLLVTAGMLAGATTSTESPARFLAAWMFAVGCGMGMSLSTASSGALGTLTAEESGVGSALMQAVQKVGAPLGSAVVGSVIATAYQSQLHLNGLPPAAASAVRASIFGGLAVAGRLHSPALRDSVRAAFVYGMDVALVVSAGLAALGLLVALAFMPGRVPVPAPEREASSV